MWTSLCWLDWLNLSIIVHPSVRPSYPWGINRNSSEEHDGELVVVGDGRSSERDSERKILFQVSLTCTNCIYAFRWFQNLPTEDMPRFMLNHCLPNNLFTARFDSTACCFQSRLRLRLRLRLKTHSEYQKIFVYFISVHWTKFFATMNQ